MADASASQKRSATGTGAQSAAKRGRTGAKSAASHAKLTFKSPAEFFAENKNIAGFDKYAFTPPQPCASAHVVLV